MQIAFIILGNIKSISVIQNCVKLLFRNYQKLLFDSSLDAKPIVKIDK